MAQTDDLAQYAVKPQASDDLAKYAARKAPQPGMLDREIPLTSYGNAILSGLQSVGRGVRDAIVGAGKTLNPLENEGENLPPVSAFTPLGDLPVPRPIVRIGKSVSNLYDMAKQVPGAVHDINASPDPLGTYAKVAQETAGQGAGQALTALATEGAARLIPKVAEPVAARIYQSALKPSVALGPERIGRIVGTALDEGIRVSPGGLEKLGSNIDDVNAEIGDVINRNPGRVISKGSVLQRLNPVVSRFSEQVNPSSDLNAISESGREFADTAPSDIPGPEAQRMKIGTYRSIGGKNYGELGSAATESQKALARGLKEELASQYPELNELNARDSRLLDLEDALERAVARSGNRALMGVGAPAVGVGTRILTGSNPLALTAAGAKWALTDPEVASRLAIALKRTGAAVARPGVGAGVAGISQIPADQANAR